MIAIKRNTACGRQARATMTMRQARRMRGVMPWRLSATYGVRLIVLLLSAACLVGCARSPTQANRGGSGSIEIAAHAPRRIRVVSSDTLPRVPASRWQPSLEQSAWAGALAGAGAGAGVGAGVCAVSIICPPCYGVCVAALGIGGAAVGAVSGRVAHRELASDPANRMLPAPEELAARLRARVIGTLGAHRGVTIEDGGAVPLSFASATVAGSGAPATPPDVADDSAERVIEIALTEIQAEALRKGGFKVSMTVRARARVTADGKTSPTKKFGYSGERIPEGGGIEADATRIAREIDRGMDKIAQEIGETMAADD